MAWALLSALAVAAVSAFVPVTPVEPYLVALAAGGQPAVPVGVAAAVGQTAGKVLIFLATRAAVRSDRMRRWATRISRRYARSADADAFKAAGAAERPGRMRRWLRLLDRPALVTPVVFVSAVTGVPPLLAVAVHAARTPVSGPVFAGCCLAGRTVRFVAVMSVSGLW
jgi:membrane protein YqaA with SNARE-associated domain